MIFILHINCLLLMKLWYHQQETVDSFEKHYYIDVIIEEQYKYVVRVVKHM